VAHRLYSGARDKVAEPSAGWRWGLAQQPRGEARRPAGAAADRARIKRAELSRADGGPEGYPAPSARGWAAAQLRVLVAGRLFKPAQRYPSCVGAGFGWALGLSRNFRTTGNRKPDLPTLPAANAQVQHEQG
jgi:hypothetical protein